MVWFVLILGAAVIATLRAEGFGPFAPAAPARPPALPPKPAAPNIGALDFTSPEALMDAAKQAQVAGYPETAKALASKAQDIGDIERAVTDSKGPIPSPIDGVSDGKWALFANLFRGQSPGEISPSFHLGLYNVGFRRLADLGLASNVRQVDYNGKRVWQGDLKPPMTVRAFLDSPTVQYKVFARDMRERSEHLRSEYAHVLGKTIEGVPASLSGLLAVIKLAGTKGFDKWVRDPGERKKFAATTAAYKQANGIF